MSARDDLAAAQAALVEALLADGAPPPGFDPVRLGRQAAALRTKRARVVATARPDLVVRLGERGFTAAFDAWARTHPPLVGRCAHAEAAAFEASLRPAPRRPRARLRRPR